MKNGLANLPHKVIWLRFGALVIILIGLIRCFYPYKTVYDERHGFLPSPLRIYVFANQPYGENFVKIADPSRQRKPAPTQPQIHWSQCSYIYNGNTTGSFKIENNTKSTPKGIGLPMVPDRNGSLIPGTHDFKFKFSYKGKKYTTDYHCRTATRFHFILGKNLWLLLLGIVILFSTFRSNSSVGRLLVIPLVIVSIPCMYLLLQCFNRQPWLMWAAFGILPILLILMLLAKKETHLWLEFWFYMMFSSPALGLLTIAAHIGYAFNSHSGTPPGITTAGAILIVWIPCLIILLAKLIWFKQSVKTTPAEQQQD